VQFLWHSGDWQASDWQLLGEDWDGTDGWSYLFTNDAGPTFTNAAFYAVAYDWGGNSIGTLTWGLSAPTAVIYMPLLMK
jgi:hypothetical protein